jgi:hypothetical protein
MLVLLVIFLAISEPIVLVFIAWYFLNKSKSKNEFVYKKIPEINLNVSINSKELTGKYKNIIKYPETIYNSSQNDVKVKKSDGDLIPFNLTDSEKELLNMFYND